MNRKDYSPTIGTKAIAQNITNRQNSIIWVQKQDIRLLWVVPIVVFIIPVPIVMLALRFYRKERILRCPRCGKKLSLKAFVRNVMGPG